jgi:hypothetical protein
MSMTEAEALLADLLAGGIELRADDGRVRWRPAFLVPAPLAQRIRSHSAELLLLLPHLNEFPRCTSCGWPLDSAHRCPKCFDRECVECGRATGSYFISHCLRCGMSFVDDDARRGIAYGA